MSVISQLAAAQLRRDAAAEHHAGGVREIDGVDAPRVTAQGVLHSAAGEVTDLHRRRCGLRQKLDHPELVRALVLAASASLGSLAAGKDEPAHPQAMPQFSTGAHPGTSTQSSAPTQMVPETIEAPPTAELDPKTRAAAERLARVLVGDVELYFPGKVAQARTQGNLYGLLRDELERSRATFVERFGEGVEVQHRIFTSTVIHQLCDDDASKLGGAPWA